MSEEGGGFGEGEDACSMIDGGECCKQSGRWWNTAQRMIAGEGGKKEGEKMAKTTKNHNRVLSFLARRFWSHSHVC